MTKLKKTIAVIGEGITEKYYLKSLQGIIKADIKPIIPNHATSMFDLEKQIKKAIEEGYNNIFCLIDMDNKKQGRNRDNYLKLKKSYHDKRIYRPKKGLDAYIRFFENERCLEIWFYFYFKITTKEYLSSDELCKELEVYGYKKTEDFFKSCQGLHRFLESQGGNLDFAIKNAEDSIKLKDRDGRDYTYSEMADFFKSIERK